MNQLLRRWHSNEAGAILLLSLASILIIMMLSWVIIDAGKSARDKIELQASADAAAYSQAAVKSRVMNMVAYTNIAKRSVIGIQALYRGMWTGYTLWLLARWSQCSITRIPVCIDALLNTLLVWIPEFLMDWRQFNGFSFGGALTCGYRFRRGRLRTRCPSMMRNMMRLIGINGADIRYHNSDLRALDNYQRYMLLLGPWWGQAEATVRGMRNGATTAASFPTPLGELIGPIPNLLNGLRTVLASAGLGGLFNGTNVRDEFPYEKMSRDHLFDNYMRILPLPVDAAYGLESGLNILHHRNRSEMGARSWAAIGLGVLSYGLGYDTVIDKAGDIAFPYRFRTYTTFGTWSNASSNLVFTYGNRPARFSNDRQKYLFMSEEYDYQLRGLDEVGYKASGYWSLARAEASYQDGQPNPFHPSWTARMRPVALPGEWDEAGYDLNQAYHDILPFMALSSIVGIGSTGDLMSSIRDFAMMERATRGFGKSTIQGVGK